MKSATPTKFDNAQNVSAMRVIEPASNKRNLAKSATPRQVKDELRSLFDPAEPVPQGNQGIRGSNIIKRTSISGLEDITKYTEQRQHDMEDKLNQQYYNKSRFNPTNKDTEFECVERRIEEY